nr:MAG TPA: hypothetical protein [Caudoviricetes sp.]DAZ66503.1 MAG TPA: hypothetical protein [Caudoviricetes sp.]
MHILQFFHLLLNNILLCKPILLHVLLFVKHQLNILLFLLLTFQHQCCIIYQYKEVLRCLRKRLLQS